MRNECKHIVAVGALAMAGLMAAANAQTQTPAQGDSTIVVEKPNYVTIALETTVNKPVADVWKRIGGYCTISEWLQIAAGCKILSGTDNEVGAVRTVGGEVLVGKTQYSYTYTQTVRAGRPYNLYHGTIEARPVTPTTTKLICTLIYRQLDAAGRCGAREGQGIEDRRVHAGAVEHEDAGRRGHAAATSEPACAGSVVPTIR